VRRPLRRCAAAVAARVGGPHLASRRSEPAACTRKRLLLRGFIVSDFAAKQGDFLRDVGEWVRTGRIKYREDIVGGLEKAPASFLGVLQGKHFGKMLVRMAT